ncbi:MAG: lipoprotein signal peptidase [Rhodospirillales bacterium]|nr:lipoprotein signal peptidase [Rhodospirillales bacterium]MBO6788569.1 lipoprotein signal peptidase [Rhodospirillales bacterium]
MIEPGFGSRMQGAAIAALMLVLDQVSKIWILTDVMNPPRVIEITPFFNLVLAWNRGVSFGMFSAESEIGPWLLTALAVAIMIALAVWLWRATSRLSVIALGMIIGGAAGNVIDRLQHGAVTDFLDFHAFGYHWPAFNVADSAICVGAVILVLESLFTRSETS